MESEPVIVVDQENCFNEEDEDIDDVAGNGQGCPDDPPQDPFFLSPFRDMRKRSLPTPQCTSGITASQVRRLSDQGAAGAAAREKAFLATLTKAPGPYTPGRRHSVITISKAPMPLFGRNRRESIAAFPSKGPRVNRRDSSGGATPSPTGSQFNLQLDIMDDIADIKAARKVRMKMWQTEDKEKMCELQSMDGENKQMSRFKEARRYSNIDVCEKIAPPIPARRRASELPSNATLQAGKSSAAAASSQSSGIVCTNTDLLSIMNSLKSSASKALQSTKGSPRPQRGSSKTTDSIPGGGGVDRRRDVLLRSGRSNSVDVANIGAAAAMAAAAAGNSTKNWFRKMSTRTATAVTMGGQRAADAECAEQRLATAGGEYVVQKSPVVVTFADERPKVSLLIDPVQAGCKPDKHAAPPLSPPPPPPPPPPPSSSSAAGQKPAPGGGGGGDVVMWDRPTGSVVDAEVLGTAIEGFLAAKKSGDSADTSPTAADGELHERLQQQSGGGRPAAKAAADSNAATRTCDTSICSSLKDLFVK
ncbi:uncharacterized protein LOC112597805 [Melanaphis sacchari]|uniref:uncharacterized protein LOC112597805 n=1 Tax=Melanaphis sacchari TaxID=742174 RepID=UPI000DC1330B|nr:uncharacterized protein LOC112597805 [Melanaphis sacchari]